VVAAAGGKGISKALPEIKLQHPFLMQKGIAGLTRGKNQQDWGFPPTGNFSIRRSYPLRSGLE
jgi:hypothetical protein